MASLDLSLQTFGWLFLKNYFHPYSYTYSQFNDSIHGTTGLRLRFLMAMCLLQCILLAPVINCLLLTPFDYETLSGL